MIQRRVEPGTVSGTAVPHGKKPKQMPGKRVCLKKGCETVLSAYNQEVMCWVHRVKKAPRVRGRPYRGVRDRE